MDVKLTWKQDMAFSAIGPSEMEFRFDTHPETGGTGFGIMPMEALLGSLAACSAMDVISILKKKRQEVHSYRVEIHGDRDPEGTWPRPFKKITLKHIFTGNHLNPEAILRAIELSETKYCSVTQTLKYNPEIHSDFEIHQS